MSDIPKDLKYTQDHEWARQQGNLVVVGVTAHAQEALGDVVYVELPKVGTTLTAGKQFGVIESTKAVSELFAPISGKVVKVNDTLTGKPDTVNADPYGAGWIIEVELSDPKQLDGLLSPDAYADQLKNA
ncbi:glycine cleavage system protein GcvH [Hyalangium sp.]|uniref:glycine cleavage system protein GcvH n=1 Tax=Hyalangium sp. TaxID=2028555 RepID=UPI002D4ABCF3|nr:glycine cleavage system protein GcvH [Hyalangium sp.]HYH96580.1 glycine cleavage system protein GcvH [Hyalangium sp.]